MIYRVVDVSGTFTRAVSGTNHFDETVEAMSLGDVQVELRLEPNDANPHGISAYVDGRQVGWLATEWTARDPWVRWMRRLDSAGIRPRFQGVHRLTTNGLGHHMINFDVPGKNDEKLVVIANRLIKEK